MSAARSGRIASRTLLGILTIILLLFMVSIVLPLAQGKVTASVPRSGGFTESLTPQTVFINGSVSVSNQGYYAISGLTLNSLLLSPNGSTLFNYTTTLPSVRPGPPVLLPVSIPVPLSALYGTQLPAQPPPQSSVALSLTIKGSYALSAVTFTLHFSSIVQLSATYGGGAQGAA